MRIKPLVVLSLVCSLSQAADTVASLGDSIKATQFVTEVDHTKLIHGNTQVVANTNGTAAIEYNSVVDKPGCMQIYIDRYSTTVFSKPITIKHHNTEAELHALNVGDPFDFTVIYDGVSYECSATLLDKDEYWSSPIVGGPSWMKHVIFDPGYYVVILERNNPIYSGHDYIGDGDEVKTTYTYQIETSSSKTIATTDQLSNFVDKSVTNGLASKTYVDSHQWDWSTQITNAPSFVPTTRKVNNHALSSDVTLSGLDISATVTSPVGGPDIVNNVQGHLSFLYQDAYNTEQTLHLKADKTDIPTVPTNVSAFNNDAGYVTANHTHSNLVNGTTQVIANQNGTASITAPTEWAFVTQLTASQRQSLAQYMQSQYSFNGDWTVTIDNHDASWWESEFASGTHSGIDYEDYMSVKIGNVTAAMGIMDWDNKICICAGGDANILNALVPSYEPQVSPIAQFIGGTKTIATVDRLPTIPANVSAFNNDANYTSGQIATNIARQIIRDAVSQVNVNIQSAEDTRAALTNLITILKNL